MKEDLSQESINNKLMKKEGEKLKVEMTNTVTMIQQLQSKEEIAAQLDQSSKLLLTMCSGNGDQEELVKGQKEMMEQGESIRNAVASLLK